MKKLLLLAALLIGLFASAQSAADIIMAGVKQRDAERAAIQKEKNDKAAVLKALNEKEIAEYNQKENYQNTVKKESVVITSEKENPYDVLQRSLYAFSKTNKNLALFRKMDYNYSGPQLSSYLQMDMGMASKYFKIGVADVTETFIPKVSKNNEYITVKYLITKTKNIVGIYEAEEIMIINSVEISGTPHLIAELFLNYWPRTVNIGGYKQGDIAFKELLGDYITISGITPKLYKIKITKGNMDVNYETTYGINKIK